MKLKDLLHITEDQSDWEIRNLDKLDHILVKLAEMVVRGQKKEPDYFGMVAACVLDPDNNIVARLNIPAKDGRRIHAERAAMIAYYKKYGEIPEGSIILTTLSPCCEHMDERAGESCTDLINNSPVHKVYCGYIDPSQHKHNDRKFTLQETNNPKIRGICETLADTFLDNVNENFADGKHPEHKGDSRRHGIPKHATLAQLDKISHQGGRKGQLAHWQANMRRGRKKAHEGLAEEFTSKQQVIDYFVKRGKPAAQGAAAWERGWRGAKPKKPTEAKPYDSERYKNVRLPYKDESVNNEINESINVADFKEILKKFLPLAKKIVKLDKMPTIILRKTISDNHQPTMGRFHNDSYVLELAIANRQPVDILRTLAHELTHARQHEEHVDIDPATGSSEENEANAVAGVVMRHFNKQYPEYLSFQPLEESNLNGRKRIRR